MIIIGGAALKKALITKAEAESDPKVRLWAKLATLIEAEEDAERQKVVDLEKYVDLLTK
jgi:hypothetical protein